MKPVNLIYLTTALLTLTLSASMQVYAADYLAIGGGAGYQHDSGNTDAYPEMMRTTQKNILVSGWFKADLWPMIFVRAGYIRSMGITEGKALHSSHGSLDSWEIGYHMIPGHLAFSFPVNDDGALYMGAGITYIFSSGQITAAEKVTFSKNLFGYGLIAGLQSKVYGPVSLFAEWNYLTAKTAPLIDTDADSVKDYSADFSGSTVHFGILYYFARGER
jgi:opacity protein-like surface antigen